MAHRTSAAALHLARTVLREYVLAVRPPETLASGRVNNLEATEQHLGIIIDHATSVHELAMLRPEIRFFQKGMHAGTTSAPQIASLFGRMLTAFAKVPTDDAGPVVQFALPNEFGGGVRPFVLTKAAREASRFIFHYYEVRPRTCAPDEERDRREVAKLAEGCLGISRALKAVPFLRQKQERLREGKATEAEVRKCLREVGVFLEYLPNYEDREEEVKLL